MTSTTRTISFIVLFLALAISSVLGTDIKTSIVPKGHPRVYVRPNDILEIKAKLHSPEFTVSWAIVRESRHPLCQAFVYLTTGQKEKGRTAIANALRELKKCTDARTPNNAMHWGACVYDWCYDLLLPKEKNQFILEFKRIAASHHPGYPANLNGHAIVGHGTEGWLLTDQLPAGLAIYDESPQMFDAAAQLFFTKFVPVRNFLYSAHMHHQGDSYIATRFQHDLLASWLFRRIGAGDVFTRQQQFVAYQLLYHLRPDGQQFRSGDTYDCSGRSNSKRRLMLLAGTYYEDPYLLEMADSDSYGRPSFFDLIFALLLRRVGLEKRPLGELPLSKYFPEPMGEMVARTGWRMGLDPESRDVVIHMRIGEYFFGNHQRKDFGTFQIYYRGPLAIASGLYQGQNQPYGSPHWLNYHHQTVAHNGLLIYDPSEKMAKGSVNDGGQRWPNNGADHPRDLDTLLGNDYRIGRVTAHEFGPSPLIPLYSYIAGNIAPAYSSSKVKNVTRSMVTFNTRDSVWPCMLVIVDRIVSTKASFKKTWLLHSIQEPMIQGRTMTIVRNSKNYTGKDTYAGKLVVESLVPEKVNITKVGGPGKEFWIESIGRNFATSKGGAAEPGNWRIEISPEPPAKSDTFLHVLTMMDDTVSKGPSVHQIKSESLIGVQVLNIAVLFGSADELLRRVEFVLDGTALTKMLICGLKSGLWSVTRNGEHVTMARATDEGKCIYLEAMPGSYCLELHIAQSTTQVTGMEYKQPVQLDSYSASLSGKKITIDKVCLGEDVYKVRWLAHETFDEEESLLHWFVEGNSDVKINQGRLWVQNPNTEKPNIATIWYCPELPADLIVRFRAQAVQPVENNASNLNIFLHARELNGSLACFGRSGEYKDYHDFLNYIITFVGGCRPGWSRLRRNPGFQLLHESDIRSEVNQEYSVATTIWKGRLRYYINNNLVHDIRDPQPLPGGRFAIRTWSTNAWWDDIEFGHLTAVGDNRKVWKSSEDIVRTD